MAEIIFLMDCAALHHGPSLQSSRHPGPGLRGGGGGRVLLAPELTLLQHPLDKVTVPQPSTGRPAPASHTSRLLRPQALSPGKRPHPKPRALVLCVLVTPAPAPSSGRPLPIHRLLQCLNDPHSSPDPFGSTARMDPHPLPQPVREALEGRPVGFTSETPALPGTWQVSESWG